MQALRKVERPRRHPGWTESMAGPALLAVLCLLMVLEVAASTRPLTPHRFPYPMLDHDGTASYRLTSSPLELSSSTETLVTQSITPPADRATGPLTSVRSSTTAGVAETSGPDTDRQTTSPLQTNRQTITSPLETDRQTTSLLQTERQTITSTLETDRETTSLLQTDRQTTSPLGMDRQTTRNPDEDVQTDPRDQTEKQTTYVPNEMERTASWNGQLSSKQSTRLVADDKATKERTVDVPTVGDDEDTRIPTDGVTDPESTKPDKGSPAATTSASLEVTVNASKPAATTFSKFVEEAEVSSLSESAKETKVTSSSTHIKKAEISAPTGPVEEETVTTTTGTNPSSKHDAGTSKSIEFTADSKPVEERLTTPRHPIGARLDIIVDEVADADSQGDPESTTIRTPTERPSSPRPLSGRPRPPANLAREPQPASENKLDARLNEVLDEEAYDRKEHLGGPWLIGTRTNDATSSSPSVFGGLAQGPAAGRSVVLYRNYDVDSQERERELEERAREQNHPADLEDSNVHEVNHYVPDDDQDEAETSEPQQQQRSVARWYLLLLAGNSTTVRLRQKDFAKYLKLNLAARLSVEYNDLRVNRVEFKPLLMVNVTIFSRPKDNEEAPLHMLADTNATLLELSGEEYHVVRFITIPSDHQDAARALPSGGFQADSYSSGGPLGVQTSWQSWHVDMGVAVYFALAAALVSVLLAVFLVGLWRYLRTMAAEVSWRPWRHYKPIVLPRWSLPLQHRLCADHIVHCAPLRNAPSVWTTAGADGEVPVQKLPRLVLEPGPQAAAPVLPAILGGEPAPSTADTLLQVQAPAPARPNSRLSLFGEQRLVVQPKRASLGGAGPLQRLQRLQPQGRHPLDVRIHRAGRPSGAAAPPRPPGPTVLGLDNPNYMLQ